MNVRTVAVLSALVALPGASAPPPVMTPGKWEITLRTELPFATPAATTLVCIAKDEIEEKGKPPKHKAADDCQTVSGGLNGNVLSYVTRCARRNATAISRFTFSGDRYEGLVEGTSDGKPMRQVYTARRVGDCDEPSHEPRF